MPQQHLQQTFPMTRPRSYQLEMFEASMKQNIIVAMDTGSGKTQIAILRIQAELESRSVGHVIWFMAPTTALCTQQYEKITSQLPTARVSLFLGSDNIDKWGEKRVWDAALKDKDVIVSTPAVLADALTHGFIRIQQLQLLIFDEAHHCIKQSSENRIMHEFYHPALEQHGPDFVPGILGLTASPTMRSNLTELAIIEANLNAITKTPRIHREALTEHTNRPILVRLSYAKGTLDEPTRLLSNLMTIVRHEEIRVETQSKALTQRTPKYCIAQRALLQSKKRRVNDLQALIKKALRIQEELGAWAMEHHLMRSLARSTTSANLLDRRELQTSLLTDAIDGLVLHPLRALVPALDITSKAERLVSFFAEEERQTSCFSGIVFVRERVIVTTLTKLIMAHGLTKDRMRCGSFVGQSQYSGNKTSTGEVSNTKEMQEDLIAFRDGRKNLMIATDVLEEGIDISMCHLVVCFDEPPNFKSFLQRRGRAREKHSKFALMMEDNQPRGKIEMWQRFEREMIEAYQDENRKRNEETSIESNPESVEFRLHAQSTGALLTADEAVSHLYHFCAVLPANPYIDRRPAFGFIENPATKLIIATVILPNSVTPMVRRATGLKWWQSERAARKDAAFQACVALYQARLLNDHFLPLCDTEDPDAKATAQLDAILDVAQQYDPWTNFDTDWESSNIYQSKILLCEGQGPLAKEHVLIATTLLPLPEISSFTLYLDHLTKFTITLEHSKQIDGIRKGEVVLLRNITHTLLRSSRSRTLLERADNYAILFSPNLERDRLSQWLSDAQQSRPALELFAHDGAIRESSLVRTVPYGLPHRFEGWDVTQSSQTNGSVAIKASRIPRRRNFPRPVPKPVEECPSASAPMIESFPAESCTVDSLSLSEVRLSLLIPGIIQHVEIALIVQRLRSKILSTVPISDSCPLDAALSASSACWVTNYQRLEFLGDVVLKHAVSRQLFADYPHWHEGYLSKQRSRLTSNNTLAAAALEAGLDELVITRIRPQKKWSAPCISEGRGKVLDKRRLSRKIVADVVEALIGATFVDSGIPAARACINAFLPEIRAKEPRFNLASRPQTISSSISINNHFLELLQKLIRYDFMDTSLLLEAFTHPSCERDMVTESYQRLEYLGDSVLDMVITPLLFEYPQGFSAGQMTVIKGALVNANFLAFCCMETSVQDLSTEIAQRSPGEFYERQRSTWLSLPIFLRHHSEAVSDSQDSCQRRYDILKDEIRDGLNNQSSYPWYALERLHPDKFYSDIIESLLGATFVDSGGDLDKCQRMVEHLGILRHMDRFVQQGYDVRHPKAILQDLAGTRKVNYDTRRLPEEIEYQCRVDVDGEELAVVTGCATQTEAIIAAATLAKTHMIG